MSFSFPFLFLRPVFGHLLSSLLFLGFAFSHFLLSQFFSGLVLGHLLFLQVFFFFLPFLVLVVGGQYQALACPLRGIADTYGVFRSLNLRRGWL